MSKSESSTSAGWREVRQRSAREGILDAAWELVREQGLSALTLRELAARAGITTPTVYAYFASKNSIYSAMFGQAATEFVERMSEPATTDDPRAALAEYLRRFVDFCTSDVARYQLLFQRTIPGFEPSTDAYAPAVRALDVVRTRLARNGITGAHHVDMWTALTTGLVSQQIANDPGGDRWARLTDEFVFMFVTYCQRPRRPGPWATPVPLS